MKHDNDNQLTTSQPLRFLSVCSGIEAASCAWHPLGWRAVAFSEIEKFPSAVLAHHYPDVPNLGDFTAIDTTKLGQVDILAGGTPCQAFSVAGLRQGLDDARGNLTLKFVELAHELADGNGLRNVVWENVVGVLSDKGNAFGCFLAGLVGADSAIEPPARGKWPRHGMVAGPKGRAAWAVKDAQFFGVAQRRRRVLVVADFGDGADPAAVLFEPEGVFRNPPARGEAGKDVAPTISARTKGGGGLGTDFDLDGGLRVDWPADVCPTLDAHYGDKMGLGNQHVFNQKAGKFVQSGFSAIAFNAEAQTDQLPTEGRDTSVNDGLTVSQRAAVATTSAVRRLTPMECERLQGFPDGYTAIPWRGKPAEQCPDGSRYKALGNSWAVPKFVWLGKRIARFMPQTVANDNSAIQDAA